MSNKVMNAVWMESKSVGLARFVLVSLADRAAQDGTCYCGARDIMDRTASQRRSVFRALEDLKKLGELVILPKKGPGGCNRYKIMLNQGPQVTRDLKSLGTITTPSRDLKSPKPYEPKQWQYATRGNMPLGVNTASARGNMPPKPYEPKKTFSKGKKFNPPLCK